MHKNDAYLCLVNFKSYKTMNDFAKSKNFSKVFVGENGRKGVKSQSGNIIVPANYDEIAYTYNYDWFRNDFPYIVSRDGKFGLVAPDGKGTEITSLVYDDIALGKESSCLLYRKDGSKRFGILASNGREITPCNLDSYSESGQTVYFHSGEHQGLWQMAIGVLLQPVYDDIQFSEPDEPIIFTLNGVKGYVRADDKSFVPQSMSETMDEYDWDDIMCECICDQYDYD